MAGIEGIDTRRGLRLNVADHALDAASEGAGVVLGYKVVASHDIGLGRLVAPFGPEIPVPGRSYFFVCPKGEEKRPAIKAFRDWVFAEIEQTRALLQQVTQDLASSYPHASAARARLCRAPLSRSSIFLGTFSRPTALRE